MFAHFTLCRYVNFQNFDRPIVQQLGTYVTVAATSLLISVSVVSILSHVAHFAPLPAKLAAIAVSFPFNYLCNRYVTFSGGFRSAYVVLRTRLSRRPRLEEAAPERG
jgi:putative flippase GtrA